MQVILELLAPGETFDELLSEYDELTTDDVLGALEYAAAVVGGAEVVFKEGRLLSPRRRRRSPKLLLTSGMADPTDVQEFVDNPRGPVA